MTIEEIIKRQKEHLTKAQISELIQATERYKQLNAANRASAMRTLSDQYRATRRGLQNTGLAGRKGKLVSGQEKAARIRANEAYRGYNAGLRQIDNAYAQNRAARMANETARENQLAEIEKIQEENDKEAARINAEYEAWLRKKKAAEDEYKRRQKEIERLRQQQAQQQQIRERIEEDRTEQSGVVQGSRIQRLAKDKHPQIETSDYARAAQEQAVQRAVNGYKQTQKVFRQQREADAMYDAMHPGSAITRAPHTDDYVMEQKRVENARQLKVSGASDAEVWFADAYGVSPNRYKTVKNENPELIKELTGAIQDLRTKNYDTVINSPGNIYDKHQAREDKAKAESAISKAAVAMGIDDAETRKLYLMDDTQFAVAFAAAAALAAARQKYDSSDAIQDQMMMSGKSGAFNNATRDAEARLAKFDQVRRLRYDTSDKTLYYDTYPTDVQTKDAKTVRSFCAINQNTTPYAWANPKNENGENWYQAAQNGWKAENDGNTKYGALVNDWSLVGGRQGMRYQQTGKVAALLANVMPHFYDLADETGTYSNAFEDTHVQSWAVHNGISTADYYDYVRNSCVKAFYGNNASHEDYEQMDAMLALANLMTDEERARFNELANGSYGAFANEADEYFEYLYKNVLPERFKAYVDELNGVFTDTTYGKIGQSALSVLTNLGEGITGPIHTLTTNYNDSVSAQLGAMKYTTAQAARESVSKDFSPVGKFFYDTGMSMADSASVAVISSGIGKALQGAGVASNIASKAGSVLGGSILGGSAFNSAYKEALDRGLAPDKARTVAVGQGFNEMLFESLSLDLLVSQFQKGGILKVSKNGFVNWFVNTMVQGGVEGSEEVFTDMANNLWDKEINGIYSEELTKLREYISNGMSYEDAKRKVDAEYAEQLGMSFLGGALSGGVMGGGASFLGMVQNRGSEELGKGLRSNNRVVNELRNFDFKSEYAQEILTQDKLTNQDVADLFNIRQQELLGQYKSDIQQAVEDGKITQEQADLLNKYEQNGVQIVKDGDVVANENGITVEQMPTVQDAIASLDNAARIQFLNNEEMRSLVQAVGGETAAVIEQSETAEREAEKAYRQTIADIDSDTTLTDEQKAERKEEAKRTRQSARSEAEKSADTALTNKNGIGAKLETDGNGTVKVGKGSGKVTYDFSTKYNPGHQTVDSMTATEQSALRIAKVVAASRGDVNVKVEAEFVGEHANENGYYDRSTNTIHINMSGDNSVLWTLSHELTHHLANTDTEAYTALRTAIETALKDSKLTTTELEDRGFEYDLDRVDPYIAREGNLWDALVAFEREEHGYGKDAEEEVVARCCESFLGFDQFVKDFARKQYKSAKAVNKFIAQMNVDMQRVIEEARQSAAQRNIWNDESPENQILRQLTEIDKIANLWRIAVNAEAKKRQTAREGTRASTMDSVKRSDAEYLDLARRYESGDKSVEAELRKAVDAAAKAAGYTVEAYHGTPNGTFTVFRGWQYFTQSEEYANVYRGRSASSISVKTTENNPKTYHVFLDTGNAFDTRKAKYRRIFEEEFYRKYGNGAPLSNRNLPDWTDGEDLVEFFDENGYEYDSIYLDEGGTGGYGDAVNDRGVSIMIRNSSQVKSADLITKDESGNIIPMSERFKTENEDIRYSTMDKVVLDNATLAGQMHQGAKGARALREQSERYNERIAQRDRLLEQVRKQRDTAKQHSVEVRKQERAARVRRDVVAVLKRGNDRIVKMLANPTENSHVPVQLAQAVAEYAQRLNQMLTVSVPKTGEFAGMEKQTQKGALNAKKIIDAYNRSFADEETISLAKAENPNFNPRGLLPSSDYDETLVKMINAMDSIVKNKHINDLTTEELQFIMNTMRGVIHTVYDANKLIGTSERKAIFEVGDSMIHQFEDAPDVKLKGYLETSLDLRRLARIFSGSNDNAEFVKLANQLNDGAIEKERVAQVLQDIFAPVTEKYGDEIRKWYGKKAEWIDTGITQNGKKVEITKGMRVSLAMHVLNAGNMNHIANGGITIPSREQYNKGKMTDAYANGETVQLSAEQIEGIISHMTEAEKAYVEAAKEFFHKRTGYYVNKTSLQLLGYRKATVENYFPIHTDKNFTKTDFASLQMDGSIEGQGFLKERVNASNPVYLEDITSVVNRQIRGVALYAGLAVPMRNFNAVMNSTEYFEDENGAWRPRTTVRKAMTQKMGEYGAKVVKGFLEDASEMTHVDVTPMERFAGKLATNYVKAVLLGNLKVAMKQVASYPTAAAVIPWKYLGKALLKGGRNGRVISRADVDLINQYTPLYQMRREGQANEIASIMAKRGMEQKLPWLLGWITKMDVMTVGRLWSAAEYMVADQQNLPVGSDEYYKAVAKVFNDTIQQTQPNFTPLQRNAALRSKNPVVRSLVLFGTQRMQNGGILMEAAYELKQSKGKSKAEIKAARMKLGRAVASQIVQNILLIVASLGVDALRGRMKSWQDEDKDITPESMMKGMSDMFLSNFIGSFLGGSETYSLFSGLFKKAMGETAYDTEFTVPALDAVETLINFAQSDVPSTIKYLLGDHTDEEKQKKAINFSYQLAKAFGYATGIPLENALKDVFKGIIPAIEDISDAIKTGELNPWLHQSGKLDKKTTNANYKEWTNNGFKGSEYFYWENILSAYGKREEKIPILIEADLPNEKKAMLLRMMDKSGATSEGTVVYKSNGDVLIDFANPTEKQQALPMPTAETEETAAPTTTPTATPKPTENPLTDARQDGVREAVAKGVPEQTAFDAFLAYQNMGKNKSDDYSRNDDFRAWLFANVDSPEQRAILEYQVIGTASRVEGSITYRESGTVYRDYTNESWFKLSEHNLAKDGTNKRYEAGKRLEKTGLSVDNTVAIYDALAAYTKKSEWTEYLKKQGLTDEQINIFLWSRGWAK